MYQIKALDIESHNDDESIAKNETSMWIGCYIDETSSIDDQNSFFYSVEELVKKIDCDTSPKPKGTSRLMIYIYNLSFEWSFFLPVLLQMGFKWKSNIGDDDDDEFVYNSISTRSCSSVWAVTLKTRRENGVCVFRDLSKIFPGGLGSVAKSFGLPTQKGEIDYRKNRLHEHIITQEERKYCFDDTKILMDVLEVMHRQNDRCFWKSLSTASYSAANMIQCGWLRYKKPYEQFRKMYPELSAEESAFLRRGVEGGITYAVPNFQFKELQNIAHIDLHQAHPSSAYLNLFPYGYGKKFVGQPPPNKISACRIKIGFDDVKLHCIIKLIGLPFTDDFELVVWNFEIPLMQKCYVNLRIQYVDGYAYSAKPLPWKNYYKQNYDGRKQAKAARDTFNTMLFKLKNNGSYGKLLEKGHFEEFENVVGGDGIITSISHPVESPPINAKYTYIPVGSCIPAYTRLTLINAALKLGWEKVVYFDTDSIFFLWDDETRKSWETLNQKDELGGWGWEELINRAQFTAPKRYKLECSLASGKFTTVKAGGINFVKYLEKHESLDFDSVNLVNSKWEVQRAYRCKGGTLIKFQEKEMIVQPKYQKIAEQNLKT